MKNMLKRYAVRLFCSVLISVIVFSTFGTGVFATSPTDSAILSYVCDFNNNYLTAPNERNCTYGKIARIDERDVLRVSMRSNIENACFVVHNSEKGDLTLNSGSMYSISVIYKIDNIVTSNENNENTVINIAMVDGHSEKIVKIKTLTGAVHKPGETSDWIMATAIFKANVANSSELNKLAINVVSPTCPKEETIDAAEMTTIFFDEVIVKEYPANTCGIEFVSNGGSGSEPIMAQPGQKIELPSSERDLYSFQGWYSDYELTNSFRGTTMPNSMITKVYAKWKVTSEAVIVNFVTNGGDKVESLVGHAGDPLNLPVAKRIGYHFSGWHDKSLKTLSTLKTFPESSITLYAKWDIFKEDYNFSDKKQDEVPISRRGYYVKYVADPADSNNMVLYYPSIDGSSNVTVCFGEKGQLRPGIKYNVSFRYKVAAGAYDERVNGDGYRIQFRFYYVTGGNMDMTSVPVNDCLADLAVVEERKLNTFSAFDPATKKITRDTEWVTVNYSFVADAEKINAGYKYLGIKNQDDAKKNTSTPCYVDDVYIRVAEPDVKYRDFVGFESNGGSFCETQYVKIGDVITLPTPERQGYRFMGWSYSEDCKDIIEDETITVKDYNTILYADWYKLQLYEDATGTVSQPEQDTDVLPEQSVENDDDKNYETGGYAKYIIIGVVAAVVVAAVVVVVIVLVRKKKKLLLNEDVKSDENNES